MDTVQLQCGNCKKVLAISVAHLGQQVQCPHCRSVLQTPAPVATAGAETVAMPDARSGPADPDATLPPPDAGNETPGQPQAMPEPFPQSMDETVPMAGAGPFPSSEPAANAEFAQFKPKARVDRSVYLVIALIFLVPYAATMTFFLIFLLWTKMNQSDALEYLRDPVPSKKDGGPRRVLKQPEHTLPVAAHRKTTLGKPVQAGDLLVTPVRVTLTEDGDLKLLFRARNTSTNSAFQPMSDLYLLEKKSPTPPYTFLETRSKDLGNVYGGYMAYHKSQDAKDEETGFAVLGPNEEITIALKTQDNYRAKQVQQIANSKNDEFTWRIQVRRGFVKVDGKDVSATTVIGVDFSSKDIEREGKS